MLEKNHFDITMVLEFTRSYDIGDEIPLGVYTKNLLLHPLAIASNPDYQTKIKDIVRDMGFIAMADLLREVLPQVHSIDYPRIHFVATLLKNLLQVRSYT